MRKGLVKRQESVGPFAISAPQSMASRFQPSIEVLIAPDDSGIAGWLLRIAPRNFLRAPVHANSGGRFHVVMGGTFLHEGSLQAPGCVYTSPEEEPLSLQAGCAGRIEVG